MLQAVNATGSLWGLEASERLHVQRSFNRSRHATLPIIRL